MAEFGEQLKKAREEKGMTQQTLAEQVYVTRQTVSRWESGDRFPDIITLKKISVILGVSTDKLLSVNDIPQIVDKNSIIEKPIVKNIIIALYTAIAVIFAIKAVISLTSPELIDELIQGHLYAYFSLFVSFSEAILLIFSLVNMLREKDTPRKNGVIIFMFFLLELCSRLHIIINRTPTGVVVSLISFIPFIIGCVGAYWHFITKNYVDYSRLLIYFPCISIIFIELLNLFIITSHYMIWINIVTVLTIVLKIMVYITFSYQAFVLEKRRKLAKGMVKA